jgi:predicted TIM-barrel fold metal-dependent hydrolase
MLIDDQGNEYFVVDDHTHLGPRVNPSMSVAGTDFSVDEMVDDMDAAGVDVVVGFPRSNPQTDYSTFNELSYQRKYPDRIVAFARIQPLRRDTARDSIKRFAGEGVRGLKFHPLIDGGQNAVNDRQMMFPLMEEAANQKLVVLIHSGTLWNCEPSLIGDLAENFPDVPVIIGHSGLWEGHQAAIATAKRVKNIYLDLSELAPPGNCGLVVHEVGAERALYGSDHPANPFGFELGKLAKYAGLKPDELKWVLGGTAAKLLGIDQSPEGRNKVRLSAI